MKGKMIAVSFYPWVLCDHGNILSLICFLFASCCHVHIVM